MLSNPLIMFSNILVKQQSNNKALQLQESLGNKLDTTLLLTVYYFSIENNGVWLF